MSIQSINPTTGEIIQTFEPYSEAQVNEVLDQVHNAFFHWRETSFAERSTHLHRVASYMREHKAELAQFSTLEMGKPIVEAEAEIEKCAWACDFYAGNAERFLADEHVATNATESYVSFLPLGVILVSVSASSSISRRSGSDLQLSSRFQASSRLHGPSRTESSSTRI